MKVVAERRQENSSTTAALLATLGNYKSARKASDKEIEDFMIDPKTTPSDVVDLLKVLGNKVYDTTREMEITEDVLGKASQEIFQSTLRSLRDDELIPRDKYRDDLLDAMDKMTFFIQVVTITPWKYQYWDSLRRDNPRFKDPSVYDAFNNKLKKNGKSIWIRLPRVISPPYEFSWKTVDFHKIREYANEIRLEER